MSEVPRLFPRLLLNAPLADYWTEIRRDTRAREDVAGSEDKGETIIYPFYSHTLAIDRYEA